MRKPIPAVAAVMLLSTSGFATASILGGGGLAGLSSTGGSTGITATTGKVTICHRTHSAKHPFVTITVSASAVPAHLRQGDAVGACTAATIARLKHGGNHGHGKPPAKKPKPTTPTAGATDDTTTSQTDEGEKHGPPAAHEPGSGNDGDHGHGDNGHGNNGHGKGHG